MGAQTDSCGRLKGKVMKISKFLLIASFLISFIIFAQTAQGGPLYISPKTLYWWMEYGESFTLINANSYLECMDTQIPRSLCISCEQVEETKALLSREKSTKIVLYTNTDLTESRCPLIGGLMKQGYKEIFLLQGGLTNWKMAGYETVSPERIPRVLIPSIKVKDIEAWRKGVKKALIVDIRSWKDFNEEHLEGAVNFPLAFLHQKYQEIPMNCSLLIVDEDGSKSLIAASYLSRKGFQDIKRLGGGMMGWREFKGGYKSGVR